MILTLKAPSAAASLSALEATERLFNRYKIVGSIGCYEEDENHLVGIFIQKSEVAKHFIQTIRNIPELKESLVKTPKFIRDDLLEMSQEAAIIRKQLELMANYRNN